MGIADSIDMVRKFFNLNQYEAKALIAVYRGARDYREISEIGEIPMPRVYDVVRSLVKKGLILFSGEGFKPVEPEVLTAKRISEVKSFFESEINRFKGMASHIANLLKSLSRSELRPGDFEEIVILDTIEQVLTFFTKAIYSSREIVMLIRKAMKFRDIFISVLEDLGEGKTVRVVIPENVELSEKELEVVRRYGIRIKSSRFIPNDLMVTSSGYVFIGFPYKNDSSEKPIVVVIKNSIVAEAALRELIKFFEELR